ncbi:NUDIX hydrolase [Halocalculus aciditolerans]|uniref:NUDIX hydrolase n=1 Tax=Halocalculus aciditolerans TaxID=1383812 RepID=A0A830FFB4_9EURY|nr:NUDIX hydrolase [Halocalculus aciditolerans]GGL47650.1 NUDIX hydrolase [Halocalculus aciditolerans]
MTEDLAWETTDARVAYECPGFDVVNEDVTLPDGTETDFDYLADDPAVVVLPFTPDGDVVLVEEWRQAVKHVNRGLPAGGIEPEDETYRAAARRELEEETGYTADALEPLGSFEPANGISDAEHHYFVAAGCTPDADQVLDFNESIRPTTMAYDALLDAVEENAITDGRTALGVTYFELFGSRPEC